MNNCKHLVLQENQYLIMNIDIYQIICLQIDWTSIKSNLYTLDNVLAISKVPTVSILDAMTGMPLYVLFEFRK